MQEKSRRLRRSLKTVGIVIVVILIVFDIKRIKRTMTQVIEEVAEKLQLAAGIKMIDDTLYSMVSKNIVATSEITDTLLDIRQIILANIGDN
jgi:hypothetical protein